MKTKSRKTIRKMRTMEKHTSSLQLLIQSRALAQRRESDKKLLIQSRVGLGSLFDHLGS